MKLRYLLFLLLATFQLFAQPLERINASPNIKVQYGVSVDLRWELVFKYGYLSNFRLGISGGAGPQIGNNFMPYLQYTLSVFQGGIGSSLGVKDRNRINVESHFTFGSILGTKSDSLILRPVYTFGKLSPNPLLHNYGRYINLASIFIKRHSKFSEKNAFGNNKFSQRVGAGSVGWRGFDLNYYNDAVPFHTLGLGDSKDRYYTGGGFINLNFNQFKSRAPSPLIVSNAFLGFDRFTGYFPDAFELAKELHLNEVPYGDHNEAYKNKGRFYGGVEFGRVPGLNAVFSANDYDPLDVQYLIHRKRKQPFHKTLHSSNFGLNTYYFSNWNNLNEL